LLDQKREQGKDGEYLDNGFGRKMRCDPRYAYTVAPALMGQGTARDITCEVLLRLMDAHPEYVEYLVGHAHDEFIFMVPVGEAEKIGKDIVEAFTWSWQNVPILCELAGPGPSWGAISAK
jgi:DNA polymerase-1